MPTRDLLRLYGSFQGASATKNRLNETDRSGIVFGTTVLLVAISLLVDYGRAGVAAEGQPATAPAPTSSDFDALARDIKGEVKGLDYSDSMAQNVVDARVPRAACCPCLITRRFQAVKFRSCRSDAARGWHEDLAIPITQSLPVANP
jgi:hypothetical protein